jgi:hypothetical protein
VKVEAFTLKEATALLKQMVPRFRPKEDKDGNMISSEYQNKLEGYMTIIKSNMTNIEMTHKENGKVRRAMVYTPTFLTIILVRTSRAQRMAKKPHPKPDHSLSS